MTGVRAALSRVVPARLRIALRPLARAVGLAVPATEWWHATVAPWRTPRPAGAAAFCNICGWSGAAFTGQAHVEAARCPQCGSVARDRFLLWCVLGRTPRPAGKRVLETSPRMGPEYRQMMRGWFRYRASDFDLRGHRADIRIDLQDIDLPDRSVDLVITPHVLEHVPDTDRALAELWRIVTPRGRVYLQVPLLQGRTAPPATPEFHDDDTPVFWRFGWDLTDRLRAVGFAVDVLVPDGYLRLLTSDEPATDSGEFVLSSIVPHPRSSDLVPVADDATATQLGFEPTFQHVVWECRKPGRLARLRAPSTRRSRARAAP